MQAIKRLQVGMYQIEIWQDPNPPHPRKWDNFGTLALWRHAGHNFGEVTCDTDGLRDLIDSPDVIALPVYTDEVGVSTRPYADWWSSGFIGVIYINVNDALRQAVATEMTDHLRRNILDLLDSEIQTLDDYLRGEVYGYRVFDPVGAEIASQWGYFDLDWCEQEAMAQADWEVERAAKLRRAAWRAALTEAREQRHWAARDVLTRGDHGLLQ